MRRRRRRSTWRRWRPPWRRTLRKNKTHVDPVQTAATAEELELLDHIGEGCSLRSKWGLRLSRAKDGGKAQGYIGTTAEKAKFRSDWCRAKLEEAVRKREKKESLP